MTEFDKAISVVDDYPRATKYFFTAIIPGLAGGMGAQSACDLNFFIYIGIGYVFSAIHFFVSYKLITHDVGAHAESLWKMRIAFIALYFFGAPCVFLFYCFQIAKGV